jgi:HD-GYP domain-containing protein (c-di-GMP phosphodiesterase class II)
MRDVGLIVRSHHERWDGTGYPDGLAGEAIPVESRIISCCDSWNAMRTDRSYRKALPHAAALAELKAHAGTQLDPHIVDAFAILVGPGDQESHGRAKTTTAGSMNGHETTPALARAPAARAASIPSDPV